MKVSIQTRNGCVKINQVIYWKSHGRVFVIDKDQKIVLETVLLVKFFTSPNFTNFQRQLNMYGFKHLMGTTEKLAYYHESFLRMKPGLTEHIRRLARKGKLLKLHVAF